MGHSPSKIMLIDELRSLEGFHFVLESVDSRLSISTCGSIE